MTPKANVWYEGVLAIGGDGQFRAVVWERENPGVFAQETRTFTAGEFNDLDWKFVAQVKSGTLDLDFYREHQDGAIGQRTRLDDGSGHTEWRYSPEGQVVEENHHPWRQTCNIIRFTI